MAGVLDMFGGVKKHEPTEIERIEQNMAQIDVNIQNTFRQIGFMFYRENNENAQVEEKYGNLIEMIKKLEQNRKSFYANKLRLEGNMMCANCGEIIPYGSVYCSKCGGLADGTKN